MHDDVSVNECASVMKSTVYYVYCKSVNSGQVYLFSHRVMLRIVSRSQLLRQDETNELPQNVFSTNTPPRR